MSYTFETFKENTKLLLSNLWKVIIVLAGVVTFATASYIAIACLQALYDGTIGDNGISILILSLCILATSTHSLFKTEKTDKVYG